MMETAACQPRHGTSASHTVYLLEELFETAQSGQDVPGLVDYIIKRLQHRSPVVKLKVRAVAAPSLPRRMLLTADTALDQVHRWQACPRV